MNFAPVKSVCQTQTRNTEHDLLFGQGFGCNCLLDDPEKSFTNGSGRTAIKPEDVFVQIALKVFFFKTPLKGSDHHPLK